jgi:HK97 gp10 family phage protein
MATKVQNLERLKRRLAAIPKAARAEIHKALEKGAQEIKTMARVMAPQDSGDLRNSVDYTFGAFTPENSNVRGVQAGAGLGDPDLSVTIHAGDAKAFYAAFIEFGTAPHPQGGQFTGTQHPGTPAQPFFFPAYRLLKKRVKSRINRAVKKAARNAVAGGGGA